ncbi:MAG: T9SS type A sorting domain-containing protein [bacterium]|nr:T9SS type A sorting domain-containing protein [bacterium]
MPVCLCRFPKTLAASPFCLAVLWLFLSIGTSIASDTRLYTTDLNQDGLLETTRIERVADGLQVRNSCGHLLGSVRDVGGDDELAFVDTNGDGYPDLVRGPELLIDGRLFNRPADGGDRYRNIEDEFVEVWNSGEDLCNVWDAEVVDFDDDDQIEIITQSYHYPGGSIRIYENSGDNNFEPAWQSEIISENTFTALCTGDIDRDGRMEIVAGEAGFDGRIYMWEHEDGAGSGSECVEVPLDLHMGVRVRKIIECDLDSDGRREYCIAAGSSDGGSSIKILEHAGVPGVNEFTSFFTHYSSDYITGICAGDSDNDGKDEILVLLGGWPGEVMVVRRFEYDPDLGFLIYKEFSLGYQAPILSAEIADVDDDGENELLLGTENRFLVVENSDDDAYQISWIAISGIEGNILDLNLGPDNAFGCPLIAFATHTGQLGAYGFDRHTYINHIQIPVQTSYTVRSIDFGLFDDGDILEDFIFTRSYLNCIAQWEPIVLTGVDDASVAFDFELAATRNPFITDTELRFVLPEAAAYSLNIYDTRGRLVREFGNGSARAGTHILAWDGCDRQGRNQAAGVYLARLEVGAASRTARLILVR